LLILASLFVLSFNGLMRVSAQEEHVYYGFVPREVWGLAIVYPPGGGGWVHHPYYQIAAGTEMTRASLLIIGDHDGTSVSVYALPSKQLLGQFTVDRLEGKTIRVSNGTLFKVVSDKPTTVIFMGGNAYEQKQAFISAFFPSVDGGYVGREFVFLAIETQYFPGGWTNQPYRVYALEDSQLALWDANGSKIKEFKLSANQVEELTLSHWAIYRLESTGRVMLGSMGSPYYPAMNGGFVGRRFYVVAGVGPYPWSFYATGLQDAKIDVWDLEFKRKIYDAKLAAMMNVSVEGIKSGADALIESDTPIVLGEGGGLSYFGLAAGQTAYVHVSAQGPTTDGEACLFAYKETTVTVDDVAVKLSPDEILTVPGGLHKLSATENVLLESVSWDSTPILTVDGLQKIGRMSAFATVIPSAQSLSITYQDLQLKPVVQEGLPWMLIAGAVAVLAVGVGAAVYFLKMRRRS